jgi:hypothetical protein
MRPLPSKNLLPFGNFVAVSCYIYSTILSRMPLLADQLTRFYEQLRPPRRLPAGVAVLYPQKDPQVMEITRTFFQTFYSDNRPRHLLLGINPGRFGAGITGINFTAPRQLTENCGISHSFPLKSELSAEFIYEVIERYGGCRKFYQRFFISAVSPLGYVKNGKNLNYYDDRDLQKAVTPFIAASIQQQLAFGFKTDHCICIGGEKNYKFLQQLNNEYQWFAKISPLPHPRFILQYRRRQKESFIQQYLHALNQLCNR